MILENEKVVTLEVVKNLAPLVENLSILKPILIGLSLFLTFFHHLVCVLFQQKLHK